MTPIRVIQWKKNYDNDFGRRNHEKIYLQLQQMRIRK